MRTTRTLRQRRGLALIFSVAAIAVLSMLAVAFVKSMQLERDGAASYVLTLRARLVAQAGLARAGGQLADQAFRHAYTDTATAGWIYRDPVSGQPALYPDYTFTADNVAVPSYAWDRNADGVITDADRVHGRLVSGVLDRAFLPDAKGEQYGASHERLGNSYVLKIQDSASKLNLNTISGTVLNHLGRILKDDVLFYDPIRNKGWDIVKHRDKIGRFTEISQLSAVLGSHDIDVLREYLTVHSWVDESVIRPAAREDSTIPHWLRLTRRAPVNINTASAPVLAALCESVNGYQVVWETKLQTDFSAPSAVDKKVKTRWIGRTRAKRIAAAMIRARAFEPFRTRAQLNAFLDALPDDPYARLESLEPGQIAALKANFDPNTRFTRFNPSAVRASSVEKIDLRGYTTELCFSSMGRFEVTSLGLITAYGGKIAARATLHAALAVYDVHRHTSQDDFVANRVGNFRTASYPESIADLGSAGSDLDGQIEMLSTPTSPADPGASPRFHAPFDADLDALVGARREWRMDRETEPEEAKREGTSVIKGSAVMPDGMLTRRRGHQELGYDARTNLPVEEGSIELWLKLVAPGHAGNNESIVYAMNRLTADETEGTVEGVALKLFRWGGYLFCERFYWGWSSDGTYSATSPYPLQSTASVVDISHWRAHEWHHLAVTWSRTLEHTLYVDGKRVTDYKALPTEETESIALGTNSPSDELTIGGYQFYSPRNVTVTGFGPIVKTGTNSRYSNSTIAGFRIYDGLAFPRSGFDAPERFVVGHVRHTHWHGAFHFDRPAYLGSISWTEHLPRRYGSTELNGDPDRPDTDIAVSVRIDGGPWVDLSRSPALGGDGRGHALAGTGKKVEYRLTFTNDGDIRPLNVTPVLDDITITYRLARPVTLSFTLGSQQNGHEVPPVAPPPPPPTKKAPPDKTPPKNPVTDGDIPGDGPKPKKKKEVEPEPKLKQPPLIK